MRNDEGITSIEMTETVSCFCPLGQQWYEADLEMIADGVEQIPDYLDVTEMLQGTSGETLTIEQLVARVYGFLREQFGEGAYVKVTANVPKGKHLAVSVSKEG